MIILKYWTFFSVILPPIILIILVLGSILFGIATPTESASLGALGSIIIAFFKKKLVTKF